jgi:hypothetical protein
MTIAYDVVSNAQGMTIAYDVMRNALKYKV